MLMRHGCVLLLSNATHLKCWTVPVCYTVTWPCHYSYCHWASYFYVSEGLFQTLGDFPFKVSTLVRARTSSPKKSIWSGISTKWHSSLLSRWYFLPGEEKASHPHSSLVLKLWHLRNTFVPEFKYSFKQFQCNLRINAIPNGNLVV